MLSTPWALPLDKTGRDPHQEFPIIIIQVYIHMAEPSTKPSMEIIKQ
jgi:hypothetical protein